MATPRPEVGPHGGPAVPLAEGRGFAEVILEAAKPGVSGRQQRVAVYFFGPDLKTALDALPTRVGVDLKVRGKEEPIRLALKPDPDRQTTDSNSRFASEARVLPIEQLIGDLKVAFGGEESTIPFAGRR
ncbi:MAG: hypothetical protein P4L84_25450 [Isosphaeraceae bacterium]|nr:hypothetical protein [Isosphaeraceae bacterium]